MKKMKNIKKNFVGGFTVTARCERWERESVMFSTCDNAQKEVVIISYEVKSVKLSKAILTPQEIEMMNDWLGMLERTQDIIWL